MGFAALYPSYGPTADTRFYDKVVTVLVIWHKDESMMSGVTTRN